MSFKAALFKIINNHGKEILKEPFKTRCLLSDYIGSDFYQLKLMEAFLEVNNAYDLHFIFLKKGLLEGRKFLSSIYVTYKEKYSKKEFVDAINPISEYLFPIEYKEYENSKKLLPKVKNQKSKVKKTNKFDDYNYINVDSFDIVSTNGNVIFEYGGHKNIEIYVNNKKQKLTKYQLINNTLHIKENANITIKLNKRVCESLNIESKNGNVEIQLPRHNGKVNKTINVKCDNGNVGVTCDCDKLQINANYGNIVTFGCFKSIEANTCFGRIRSIFCREDRKDIDIKFTTKYGDIRGEFVDLKLYPKINKVFGKDKYICRSVFSNDCKINLVLSSHVGRIVFK